MNNKATFLEELERGLAVLAEAERQDILSEYAQHIDLGVAGGLTEEEAIRDFGDVRQLTAEILEAYHVDPAYGAKPAPKLPRIPDPRPALARTGSFFQRLGGRFGSWCSRVARAIAALPRRFSQWVWRLTRRTPPTSQEREDRPMETTTTPSGENSRTDALGRFFRRLGRGLGRLCRLASWLLWNGVLLLCAVPIAGLGLAMLVCLGLLLVWLTQGLPLAGSLLGCLGLLACCIGALGLGSGLIWHRPAAAETGEIPPPQVLETVQRELGEEENRDAE